MSETAELLKELEEKIKSKLVHEGWTPPLPEESKKYELSETGWYIKTISTYEQELVYSNYTKAGATRKTRKSAELAADRMRRMMRLSALAAELGGERRFVRGLKNWSVFRYGNKYTIGCTSVSFDPEKVYMTEDCAKEIYRMLNDGEFEL